jgi:hypothetical protein
MVYSVWSMVRCLCLAYQMLNYNVVIKRRKWGLSKTQLSWFCIYCGDSDYMFRPCLAIFRSQCWRHAQMRKNTIVCIQALYNGQQDLVVTVYCDMLLSGGWFWVCGLEVRGDGCFVRCCSLGEFQWSLVSCDGRFCRKYGLLGLLWYSRLEPFREINFFLLHIFKYSSHNTSTYDILSKSKAIFSSSWWQCCLRRRSGATRFLGSSVGITLMAWIFVSCACCVLCS